MKRYKLVTLLLLFSVFVSAQNTEIYFRFTEENHQLVNNALTHIISIDNVNGDTIYAYANQGEWIAFQKMGYKAERLPNPSLLNTKSIVMATSIAEMVNWDRYPTYEVYRDIMKQFEVNYPDLCKLDSIGTSVQGRKIYAMKISDNVNVEEDEPEVFYTSTMHGDEATGYVLMLRLIDYLLANYGTNPRATNLVNKLQIYINPNANPDGTYSSGNSTVSGATRYNANSVDLNRNFPDIRTGLHPDNKQWQPENLAMMDFAAQHHFVLSANFHGGTEVVNYPWDTWTSAQLSHPDNDWFVRVCRQYADSAQANSPSGYMDALNNGITNGGDWYVVTGGRQDYMNYWHRCREITIELSDTKLIGSELLPAHWDYNRTALLTFLEQATYGFTGFVKNTANELISSEVFVINHDRFNSSATTNTTNGQFYRPIEPGTYDIVAYARGYKPQFLSNITIGSFEQKEINFTLQPCSDTVSAESFEYLIPERFNFSNGSWTSSNQQSYSGSYSLKSASISDNQTTEAILNIEVKESGELSFYHITSSEMGYDYFRFFIDDILQIQTSGTNNWTRFATFLSKGNHTLKWSYSKDNASAAGSDCVFIDDLVLPKILGDINLTATVNSTPFEGLTLQVGDSLKITNAEGKVSFSKYPLDTIVTMAFYSENNKIGESLLSLPWQKINHTVNITAHYNANFEITGNGNPISDAIISFAGQQKQTDQSGKTTFNNVPFGTSIPYSISREGFTTKSGNLRLASDSTYQFSLLPTGINLYNDNFKVDIYPNPASDNLNIGLFVPNNANVSIRLIDIYGKTRGILFKHNHFQGELTLHVEIEKIAQVTGIAILEITINDKTIRKKIVINR